MNPFTYSRIAFLFVVCCVFHVWAPSASAQAPAAAPETKPDKAAQAKTLKAIRNAVEQVVVSVDNEKIKRLPDPVFRFEDPTRNSADGAIWAWGKGRPTGLTTIARHPNDEYWMVETVSFSKEPFSVNSQKMIGTFETDPIPDVDPPHKSAARRKLQLKMISKKFRAYQMWDDNGAKKDQRYELRMLTSPVLEYSDEALGVISGAVFIFSYGMNPELAMVIEAHEDSWHYGFGRMGWASASVNFDDKSIFEQPKIRNGAGDYRYLMNFVPVAKDEDVIQAAAKPEAQE